MSSRGTVLFFPGLWMTGAESFVLSRHLREQGWNVRIFPYSSHREPLTTVARRGARYVRMLAQRTRAPVHLVGHSLGGVLIYRLFETGLLDPARFSGERCRVLMIGSPIQGSLAGRGLHGWWSGDALMGEAASELTLPPRTGDQQRRWTFAAQLGVIAGTRAFGPGQILARLPAPHDGTVSVEETLIDGATDRCTVDGTHTFLLHLGQTARQVTAFLERGRFEAVV